MTLEDSMVAELNEAMNTEPEGEEDADQVADAVEKNEDGAVEGEAEDQEDVVGEETVDDEDSADEGYDGVGFVDEDGEPDEVEETDADEGEADEGDEAAVEAVGDTPQISDAALTYAVQSGISISDARLFGSEEALVRVADSLAKSNSAKNEEKKEVDLLDGLPELDPETYDKEVIQTFDAMKKVIREQRDQIGEIAKSATSRDEIARRDTEREIETWFDDKVNGLGKDFVKSLGEGSLGSLREGSPQRAKREAIADHIGIMVAGYEASDREMPPRDELFATAARSIMTDEFQAARDSVISGKLKKRSGQHIQRAGSPGKKKQQSARDEIAAMLDAKYG